MRLMILSLISLSAMAAHATSYTLNCVASNVTIAGTVTTADNSAASQQVSAMMSVVSADQASQLQFTGTVATQNFEADKSAARTRIEMWTDTNTKPLYAFSTTLVQYADGSTQESSLIAVDQQPYQATCTLLKK